MVWVILYNNNGHKEALVDIELFWYEDFSKKLNTDRINWLDAKTSFIPETIINYSLNVLNYKSSKFIKELNDDLKKLNDIRLWMFEIYDVNGKLKKSDKKFDKTVYQDVNDYIDDLVKKFAEKWNFEIDID